MWTILLAFRVRASVHACMRLEGAKYMHENIPRSKMYIFKDNGHLPSMTATDEFNKVLKEFITTGKLLKD